MALAFAGNANGSATAFGNGLTDTEAETGTLDILVEFDKTLENGALLLLGNACARIFAIDVHAIFSISLLFPVAHADMPLVGILDGVGDKVGDDLLYATLVEMRGEG